MIKLEIEIERKMMTLYMKGETMMIMTTNLSIQKKRKMVKLAIKAGKRIMNLYIEEEKKSKRKKRKSINITSINIVLILVQKVGQGQDQSAGQEIGQIQDRNVVLKTLPIDTASLYEGKYKNVQ
jgi:hypothetical protein